MAPTLEQELKKNPQLSKVDIEVIREWVEKQPHLPKISDRDIAMFLHSCFYSIEKAKHTIETYFTVRTHASEIFSDRDPNCQSFTRANKVISFYTLPENTPKGEVIIYVALHDSDPSNFFFNDLLKYVTSVTDLMLRDHGTEVGYRIVINLDQSVVGHLTRITIGPFKKFLFYLQEAVPIRLIGLHFINPVLFMDKLLMIMRPFIKQDLMKMLFIHTHAEMENFYKCVPQNILPKDLGGDGPSIEALREQTFGNIKNNKDYLEEIEKVLVNEDLRQGEAKSAGEIFGVEGSFKKLDID